LETVGLHGMMAGHRPIAYTAVSQKKLIHLTFDHNFGT